MNSEKFPEQLILLKTNLDKERPGRKAYQVLDNFAFIVCILRSPSIPVPIFDFPFGFDKSFDKSNACKIHFFLSTTLLKDINEFLEPWEIASTFFSLLWRDHLSNKIDEIMLELCVDHWIIELESVSLCLAKVVERLLGKTGSCKVKLIMNN